MLARHSPQEAYRRVDIDARIAGADGRELVALCFEQLVGALGTALHAAARRDNGLKSQALTRALSAVTALRLGVSGDGTASAALIQFYDGTRRALLDSATAFDPARLAALQGDCREVGAALVGTQALQLV